ncbi:uncharacterized protein [Henckelia pumila]|uniref:uncharacterized protein n=1 Tax=Henckelia pumila TaxID=405737 RepID=UPI003C6DE9DD
MRKHNLKLNPMKCAFGVKAENFLGFLVHQRGVEVDQNKSKAIFEARPPKSKKELQRFLGQVNYLRRFISNFSGKTKEFSQLLKLKESEKFMWEAHHQEAFERIKEYLSKPPILMPPRPVLSGRIGKWSLALTEFTLIYCSQKSIKGQAIADFLAHHPGFDELISEEVEIPVCGIEEPPWTLKFDGSSTEGTAGAGIVIISPIGVKTALSFNLDFPCTNNQAEYEASVIGLEILKDFQAKNIQPLPNWLMIFDEINFQYVPRHQNWEANELAQIASGLRLSEELTHRLVLIQKKNHPSIIQRGLQVETFNLDVNLAGDWRYELKEALKCPEKSTPYGLRMKVLNYILVEGDLYRKGMDGLLL